MKDISNFINEAYQRPEQQDSDKEYAGRVIKGNKILLEDDNFYIYDDGGEPSNIMMKDVNGDYTMYIAMKLGFEKFSDNLKSRVDYSLDKMKSGLNPVGGKLDPSRELVGSMRTKVDAEEAKNNKEQIKSMIKFLEKGSKKIK